MTKKEPPPVSLRFYFLQQHDQPISFFVAGRVTEVSQYMNSSELAIITITFSQRPPDDLIDKVGTMLEANSNAIKRKEERVVITDDTKRRLNISKDETIIFIQNVPRRCILRDISFSGAKVILLGIEKFINEKEVVLRIHFDEPDEIITLAGRVVKTSPVENRPEIIYACLQFDETKVPTSYKIRINNYLTTVRKNILTAVSQEQENNNREKLAEAVQNASQNAGIQPAAEEATPAQSSDSASETPATQPQAAEAAAPVENAEAAPATANASDAQPAADTSANA